ncbi:Hypothetical protein HDN1F_28850 [gamma proteobacterium HdN1]|nr:Hypothetical protein HDN1F_28850 [gamma proteobacterium HdN1]
MKKFTNSIFIIVFATVAAGLYGAAHNQISYTISPEYFTNIKFAQFGWLLVGFGDRVNAGLIGFSAACWFGTICGTLIAFRMRHIEDRQRFIRFAFFRLVLVLITSALVAFGVSFYSYSQDASALLAYWQHTSTHYRIKEPLSFAVVAQMHRMSYVGGVIGMLWLLLPAKKLKAHR